MPVKKDNSVKADAGKPKGAGAATNNVGNKTQPAAPSSCRMTTRSMTLANIAALSNNNVNSPSGPSSSSTTSAVSNPTKKPKKQQASGSGKTTAPQVSSSPMPASSATTDATLANSMATLQVSSPANSTSPGASSTSPSKLLGPFGVEWPPQPPSWGPRHYDTFMSGEIYKTFPVDRQTSEFTTIAEMMAPYWIISAEQIVNPRLWSVFTDTRKSMIKSKTSDLNLLRELGFGSPEVVRSAKLAEDFPKNRRLKTKYGEYSANEALLLHCTSAQANLEKIMRDGLDERLGAHGYLGRGIYFADNPEKSIQYDKTFGTVLIFGVLLGDCLSLGNALDISSVREREKEEEQKRNRDDQFFDSITGRPPLGGGHNEYVIYNRQQSYPFYIVKYQRRYLEYPGDLYPKVYYKPSREAMSTFAWREQPGEKCPLPSNPGNKSWPFFASTLFGRMGKGELTTGKEVMTFQAPGNSSNANSSKNGTKGNLVRPSKGPKPEDEECTICCNKLAAFSHSPLLWKELNCSHRLCLDCHKSIEIDRMSMSGLPHLSTRCPFCNEISGIKVGDCPDGYMIVQCFPCVEYGGASFFNIGYKVEHGGQLFSRTAFLPNNEEGQEILGLLRTAWERRLIFQLGNSLTTGQQNVPIWNIHHKTSLTGGPANYGYPDPGYFQRVKEELKANGIE